MNRFIRPAASASNNGSGGSPRVDATPVPSPGGSVAGDGTPAPRRLLDQLRDKIRLRHYSIRTETSYVGWARRYILFHGKRHPRDMGAAEVQAFLTDLATSRGVSSATQSQAK